MLFFKKCFTVILKGSEYFFGRPCHCLRPQYFALVALDVVAVVVFAVLDVLVHAVVVEHVPVADGLVAVSAVVVGLL